MKREDFQELANNDMPAALLWLFDQLEAAELTVATFAGKPEAE